MPNVDKCSNLLPVWWNIAARSKIPQFALQAAATRSGALCWSGTKLQARTLTIFDPSKIGFPSRERLLTIQFHWFWPIWGKYRPQLFGHMSTIFQGTWAKTTKNPPGQRIFRYLQSWNISTSLHPFHVQGSGLCTWTLKFGHRSLSTLAAAGGGIPTDFSRLTEPHVLSIIHVGHPNMTDMIWHNMT